MTGIINIKSGTYIIRNDHGHGDKIWAWDIKGDYTKGTTHKWNKIPNNAQVHIFDIDNPPQTVPYQPIIN